MKAVSMLVFLGTALLTNSVFFLALSGNVSAQHQFHKMASYDISFDSYNKLVFEKATFGVNWDSKTNETVKVSLRPDMTVDILMVGVRTNNLNTWGVSCAPEPLVSTTTNCQFDASDNFPGTYEGHPAPVYLGESYFVVENHVNTTRNKAEFYFLGGKDPKINAQWPLKTTGVIGLGPQNGEQTFAKYMSNQYSFKDQKAPFTFNFDYYLDNPDSLHNLTNNNTWQYSRLHIGGYDKNRLDDSKTQAVINQTEIESVGNWVINKASISFNSKSLKQEIPLCISNTAETFFSTSNIGELKNELSKNACGEYICKTDPKDLGDLSITFVDDNKNHFSVNFRASDVGFLNDQGFLDWSVGSMANWKGGDACENIKGIGIGRAFLARNFINFEIDTDKEESKMVIGQLNPFVPISFAERLVLAIFGWIMLVTVLAYLVYRLKNKEEELDESNVTSYKSMPVPSDQQ